MIWWHGEKSISYIAAAEAEERERWQVEINTNFSLVDGMLPDHQTDHKAQDSRSQRPHLSVLSSLPSGYKWNSLFIYKYIKKKSDYASWQKAVRLLLTLQRIILFERLSNAYKREKIL